MVANDSITFGSRQQRLRRGLFTKKTILSVQPKSGQGGGSMLHPDICLRVEFCGKERALSFLTGCANNKITLRLGMSLRGKEYFLLNNGRWAQRPAATVGVGKQPVIFVLYFFLLFRYKERLLLMFLI